LIGIASSPVRTARLHGTETVEDCDFGLIQFGQREGLSPTCLLAARLFFHGDGLLWPSTISKHFRFATGTVLGQSARHARTGFIDRVRVRSNRPYMMARHELACLE
jgi:hypothetical protein